MTTVTFKVPDEKAQAYRRQAKAAGLTLSEVIRRKMDGSEKPKTQKRVQEYVRCEYTTDSHLLALAEKHQLQLATLGTGIPGAFIIPE